MEGRAWWAAVHGVAKSRTWLSDFTFTFHFLALEKEMATHSSVLAWRIPGTGEPHGLPSMGLHKVGHDWSDLAAAAVGNRTLRSHTTQGLGKPRIFHTMLASKWNILKKIPKALVIWHPLPRWWCTSLPSTLRKFSKSWSSYSLWH